MSSEQLKVLGKIQLGLHVERGRFVKVDFCLMDALKVGDRIDVRGHRGNVRYDMACSF